MTNLPVELRNLIDSCIAQYRDDLVENFRNGYSLQEVTDIILDSVDAAEEFEQEARTYCGEAAKQLQADAHNLPAELSGLIDSCIAQYHDDLIVNFCNGYSLQEVTDIILDSVDAAEEFEQEARAYCGEAAKQLQADAHKHTVKIAMAAQTLELADAWKAEGLDPAELLAAISEYFSGN